MFLANVLEQLDISLEHASKKDALNARFSLMLTDNAVELILHQIALDRARELKAFPHLGEAFKHTDTLERALGRNFEPKLKFAKIEQKLTADVADTIATMHGFRNEVYHIGLQHQAILPALSVFYFDVACNFLAAYRPMGLSWGSGQSLPERARKFFKGADFFPGSVEEYQAACRKLGSAAGHDPKHTIAILTDHLNEVIDDQDLCIQIVADGVYQTVTRDQAVTDAQVWKIGFSEKGKAFASERGFSGSIRDYIAWLGREYPMQYRADPIPQWRKRAASLRSEKNAHTSLRKYQTFMSETAAVREAIIRSAELAEAEIQSQIDRARGK